MGHFHLGGAGLQPLDVLCIDAVWRRLNMIRGMMTGMWWLRLLRGLSGSYDSVTIYVKWPLCCLLDFQPPGCVDSANKTTKALSLDKPRPEVVWSQLFIRIAASSHFSYRTGVIQNATSFSTTRKTPATVVGPSFTPLWHTKVRRWIRPALRSVQ